MAIVQEQNAFNAVWVSMRPLLAVGSHQVLDTFLRLRFAYFASKRSPKCAALWASGILHQVHDIASEYSKAMHVQRTQIFLKPQTDVSCTDEHTGPAQEWPVTSQLLALSALTMSTFILLHRSF